MFETARLVIRPFEESDFKIVKRGLQRIDHLRFGTDKPLAPHNDETIKGLIKSRQKHELPHYAVCHKPADYDAGKFELDDDVKPLPVMGTITFQNHNFDYKNRHCDLGIGFFDPKDRGKGYGTEVLRWALEYGFMELGLHRIGLVCYSHNEAGIALYKKIGFKEEGRLFETVFSNGKWYDTLMFGMLQRHWQASRQEGKDLMQS